MGLDDDFLEGLATFAVTTLGYTGLRLPHLLRELIVALSKDTGIPEIALQHELLWRVRVINANR